MAGASRTHSSRLHIVLDSVIAHLVLPIKLKVVSVLFFVFFHWQHVHNASHPPEGRVIYSGPGLFSEDAQRKCLTLSCFLCVIIIWSRWGRGWVRWGVVAEYYQQMCLWTWKHCPFLHIECYNSSIKHLSPQPQVSEDLLQSCCVFFSSLGDFRQRLTGRASGLMCSCAFVSVHRMWRQPAGQQREFFLSWIPKWILGLHALHLENISHTGGKGTSLRKVSDLCLKAPQIKSLAPSCWCSLLVSSYLSEI